MKRDRNQTQTAAPSSSVVPSRRHALRWLGSAGLAAGLPSLGGCGGADEGVEPVELSARATAAARPAPTAPSPPSWAIGANVGVYDWAPSPFVDVVRSSRGFGATTEYAENLSLPRDSNGWPAGPSRLVVCAAADRPGTEWAVGRWKGRWRGPGNLTDTATSNGVIENVVRNGDTVTFDWVVNASPTLILTWDGAVRELRIVRPGFDLDNHPLLHPDALNYYKRFHTLRFLDFMDQSWTEDQGEATWAQRQPAAKTHGRRSWETMAEFFNACYNAPTSKVRGIWWNVPYRFGESDCLQMGQRLAQLLPAKALKFPELSNELWNSASPGKWNHFLARANNPADADHAAINTPATANQYERLGRLWALQTARMARAMKQAFPGAFGKTLFPVMASQFHNMVWVRDFGLPWLALTAQRRSFGAPGSYIGTLATAGYVSGTREQLDAAANAGAMLAGMRSGYDYSLAVTRNLMPAWRNLKQGYGIARLDAYEWQLGMEGSANAQVKLDATLAAGAGDLVRDLAYAMRDAGFQAMCFFAGTPQQPLLADGNSFFWALNHSFGGEPTAKERAVRQLIAESAQ
jgi:hypothetical protein